MTKVKTAFISTIIILVGFFAVTRVIPLFPEGGRPATAPTQKSEKVLVLWVTWNISVETISVSWSYPGFFDNDTIDLREQRRKQTTWSTTVPNTKGLVTISVSKWKRGTATCEIWRGYTRLAHNVDISTSGPTCVKPEGA